MPLQSESEEYATCPKDRRLSWTLALDDVAPSAAPRLPSSASRVRYARFREIKEQFIDPKLDACVCASLAARWLSLEVGATPFWSKELVVTAIKT
jgi:hypothetical protein